MKTEAIGNRFNDLLGQFDQSLNSNKDLTKRKLAGVNIQAFDTVTVASDLDSVRTDFLSKNVELQNKFEKPPMYGNFLHSDNFTRIDTDHYGQRSNTLPRPSKSVISEVSRTNTLKSLAESEARLQSQKMALQSHEAKLKSIDEQINERRTILKGLTFKCHDTQRTLNNADDELSNILLQVEQKKSELEELTMKKNESRVRFETTNMESNAELESNNKRLTENLISVQKEHRLEVEKLNEKIDDLLQTIDELKEEKHQSDVSLKIEQESMKEEQNTQILDLKNEHQSEVDRLHKDFEYKIAQIKTEIEKVHQSQIKSLTVDHNSEVLRLKKQYTESQTQITEIRRENAEQMENLYLELKESREKHLNLSRQNQETNSNLLNLESCLRESKLELETARNSSRDTIEALK